MLRRGFLDFGTVLAGDGARDHLLAEQHGFSRNRSLSPYESDVYNH